MELINNAALERGIVVPVLVRLTAGSQFGLDEADVLHIIDHRADYAGIEIVGIHYFSGTQKRKAKAIIKELDYLMAFFAKLESEHSFKAQRLEYGTGLAVDYFTAEADEAEQARLNDISEKIREVAELTELTVEMGRFFAAPCGYYLTKVMDTKTNQDINYAIVDGGLNQLKYDGQIQGMQIPVITHIKGDRTAEETEAKAWTLCGSLCTTADILARNAQFADLQIGDILVFHRSTRVLRKRRPHHDPPYAPQRCIQHPHDVSVRGAVHELYISELHPVCLPCGSGLLPVSQETASVDSAAGSKLRILSHRKLSPCPVPAADHSHHLLRRHPH